MSYSYVLKAKIDGDIYAASITTKEKLEDMDILQRALHRDYMVMTKADSDMLHYVPGRLLKSSVLMLIPVNEL